jgi:hypothetical protein
MRQLLEAQARLREFQEDAAAYRDDISSSRVLGKLLEASGLRRPSGYEAHHIVAGNSEPADEGRKILRKFGIRIKDPTNGVWLHTYEYMDAVNKALRSATTKEEAIGILKSIAQALQSGGYR